MRKQTRTSAAQDIINHVKAILITCPLSAEEIAERMGIVEAALFAPTAEELAEETRTPPLPVELPCEHCDELTTHRDQGGEPCCPDCDWAIGLTR